MSAEVLGCAVEAKLGVERTQAERGGGARKTRVSGPARPGLASQEPTAQPLISSLRRDHPRHSFVNRELPARSRSRPTVHRQLCRAEKLALSAHGQGF